MTEHHETETMKQNYREMHSEVKSSPGRHVPSRNEGRGRNRTSSPNDGGGRRNSYGNGGRRPHTGRSLPSTPRRTNSKLVPPIEGDSVRVISLGGVEEVGKNMILVENKDDIFISDAGFQFSEVETPGIDYIIPNITYLEERRHKIRGLLITHGHLDHIGGIPYIMEKLGNPPIYTRQLTGIMIRKRHEEFPTSPKLEIIEVEPGQKMKLGSTFVKFFSVTHSIPDSMGISIETPHGNVLISGDLRLEHKDGVPVEYEQKTWGEIGKEKNLLFIADSTNAWQAGWSVPESAIYEHIEKVITEVPGRLIIGTFASQFARLIQLIKLCEKHGKKVITEGRSIKTNIDIALKAGLLETKKDTIIPVQEIDNYPADRIVILATGAQGEEFAALARMGRNEHRYVKLNERDTILLSSSIIPGNELSVQKLKDLIYQYGLKVVHYRTSDVHASGHGNQEELAWINTQVGAKFFMPGYGNHFMIREHAGVAERVGVPKENIIIPRNGNVIDIEGGEKINVHKEKVPAWDVFVDGFSVSDMQEIVIRDRMMLAQDGMFIIIVMINPKTKRIKKSPDVISRGFVYLKESQELLQQARKIARKTVEEKTSHSQNINFDSLKRDITDSVSRFLFQKTKKQPMVIPVILGI